MAKRSGTKRSARGKRPEPTFFVDRDLGDLLLPGLLEAAGLNVEPHCKHLKPDALDPEIFGFIKKKGWVFLSHDGRQRYRAEERDAIMRCGVRCFHIKGEMPNREKAQAVIEAMPQIVGLLRRHRDPFIARIYKPTPSQPQRVRMDLTLAAWTKAKGTASKS